MLIRQKIFFVICASLFLSGCIPGLPFFEKSNYRIEGISGDEQTNEYLNAVLKDGLEAPLVESDDPIANKRRENYREQTIKADLQKAMEAKGYYDARISYADENKDLSGVYSIESGDIYQIASVNIEPPHFEEEFRRGVKAGDILDAEKALTVQQRLLRRIQRKNCYFNLEVNNEVVVDRVNHKATLTYRVEAGEQGYFGPVAFTGQENVKISYLKRLVPWKEGECYRREEIEEFKTTLLETGLFSRADAILPEAPAADGAVPVEMQLSERAHRTLRAGISYYTDEGVGTLFGWEHRNFFGAAEKLTTDLTLSSLKQSLDLDFLKSFFLRKDQSLSLNSALRRQDTDAFEEFGFDIGADINRKFSEQISGSTGVAFTLTQIEDKGNENEEKRTFGLVSFPNSLSFDNRDNKLDPREGWLLTASVEPFYDALGESDPFIKNQFGASTYFGFGRRSNTVLAARLNFGNIVGGDVLNIPPTERFYAGGGGSVRGFGYQEIGPTDDEGDPLGGRAFVTASTELRYKFTRTLGGVVFVDAGSVTEESYPDFQDMAVGAGIGARYYTSFGPLRFDIAMPLSQKDDLEQNYQFYISIGQAF